MLCGSQLQKFRFVDNPKLVRRHRLEFPSGQTLGNRRMVTFETGDTVGGFVASVRKRVTFWVFVTRVLVLTCVLVPRPLVRGSQWLCCLPSFLDCPLLAVELPRLGSLVQRAFEEIGAEGLDEPMRFPLGPVSG